MGAKRVETTLVSQEEAARLLGVEPAELPRLLRKNGIKGQKMQVAERRAVVYGLGDVAADGTSEPVSELLVGTATVADILGVDPPNVVKMLRRRRLERQTVALGRRPVTVYHRDDVERVRRTEEKRLAVKA